MNKSRAMYLDMALVVSPANPSVQFLWKSGTGGRNEMKQVRKTKCFINHLIQFFLPLCASCFSQLPESDLIGNRFDEHDWDKISNIHVSWGISCFIALFYCRCPSSWASPDLVCIQCFHLAFLQVVKWSQLVRFGDLILENWAVRHIWNAKYWFSSLSRCLNPSYETKHIFVVSFSLMGIVAQRNWGGFGKIGSIQASTKRNGRRRK